MTEEGVSKERVLIRAATIVFTLLWPISLAVGGWLVMETVEAHERLVVIKQDIALIRAESFTKEDALGMLERVTRIEKNIASLPHEVPPGWFKELVYELRARVSRLEHIKGG